MEALRARGKISSASTFAILAAFLFANALCNAPRVHEKLHGTSIDHECAVTLIASGKYEQSGASPLVPASSSFVEFSPAVAIASVSIPALFLSASIFEHAPPAVS